MACCDRNLGNIIILGISFMLIFAAFQTCAMVEKAVLSPIHGFGRTAYISLGVLYAVFSLSNWAAPSVVSFLGPKVSMIFGSLLYFLFIFSFLKPMVWALYLGSVLTGFGAAILWTAQGNALTINSNSETVARNSGIFWAIFQSSLLIGNIYSYFVFKGQEDIGPDQRTKLFIALSAASLAGTLCLLLLRKNRPAEDDTELTLNASEVQPPDTPLNSLKRALQLMRTREIILLCFAFAYTGLELTFFSGVYGSAIANNLDFGTQRKGLLAISGIFIGIGEISGGAVFGLFGKRTNVYGRDVIVMLGYIVHMVAFYIIFINLPQHSPIKECGTQTGDVTYIHSNEYLAILCSFLLGFGDSSFNTQLYSILGYMYQEDSAPAFALFKFVQSIAAAVAFYYSDALILQWQLLILVVTGTLGAMCFNIVEWENTKAVRNGYKSI